jgi:hypothetical protein
MNSFHWVHGGFLCWTVITSQAIIHDSIDYFKSPISGGSIVLIASKKELNKSNILKKLILYERKNKINSLIYWKSFKKKCQRHRLILNQQILALNQQISQNGAGLIVESPQLPLSGKTLDTFLQDNNFYQIDDKASLATEQLLSINKALSQLYPCGNNDQNCLLEKAAVIGQLNNPAHQAITPSTKSLIIPFSKGKTIILRVTPNPQ